MILVGRTQVSAIAKMQFFVVKIFEVDADSRMEAIEKSNTQDPTRITTSLKAGQHHPRPGIELKKLLSRFGLKPAPGCKCGKHIREMDQNGIKWCRDNIDTIVGWLREEAKRSKLPFTEIGARILIKRAISNATKQL